VLPVEALIAFSRYRRHLYQVCLVVGHAPGRPDERRRGEPYARPGTGAVKRLFPVWFFYTIGPPLRSGGVAALIFRLINLASANEAAAV
jgi:hypothetical protein